jgi:hypothetical protein
MRKIWATLFGIVAAVAVTTTVQAIPISGTIAMGGEATLDNANLASATTIESWPLAYVVADSGSFSTGPSAVPDFTMVTMTAPWNFELNSPAFQWSAGNFTFTMSSDSVSQSANFLTIIGFGTIADSTDGFDPTAFQWELSDENPTTGGASQFTFSVTAVPNSNGSPVPDGGLTVALLGLSLACVEGLRRKLSKA